MHFTDYLADIHYGTNALDNNTYDESVLELLWLLSWYITLSFIFGIVSEIPDNIILCDTDVAPMVVIALELTQPRQFTGKLTITGAQK